MKGHSLLLALACALSQSAIGQQEIVLRIRASDAIHFVVTDPLGRKTGCDPRGNEQEDIINGIPHSNYSFDTVGDIPPPGDSASVDVSLLFEFGPVSAENYGLYSILVVGRQLGTYRISSSLEAMRDGRFSVKKWKGNGAIDEGQVVAYTFHLPPVSGDAISLTKVVYSSTLRQDVDNSFKLKLLGDQGFHKELSNILDNHEKHLSKKDTVKAVKELEKFQDKITKEYNKGIKPKDKSQRDKRFVTADAWEILYHDAQYIIEHLIRLPPEPTGTLLQQIDELKTEVLQQQGKKNIGGSLLIKSLTLFADQAGKHLLQGDSTKAALSLRLFQLLVDETHELTEAITAKKKPLPPVFVKDEAYVQLHYRAKYIFETLPEPRIALHQHRLQTVDKELLKELESLKGMIEQK